MTHTIEDFLTGSDISDIVRAGLPQCLVQTGEMSALSPTTPYE